MSRQRLFSSNGYAKPKMLITLALLLLMPGGYLLARSYRGSIRGHVVDPSGSMMAGGKGSGQEQRYRPLTRATVTGADGGYVLAELAAGRYVVMAQEPPLMGPRVIQVAAKFVF